MASMLSGHIVDALSQYFHVTKQQLNLSVVSGTGTIDNLVLKPESLDEFDLPFVVDSGVCRRVAFTIPWTALRSQPCECTIDSVELLATNLTREFTADEIAAKLERAKERMIANFEKQRREMLNDDENQGFGSRLFEMIVHNLMLDIKRVHVRFEASTRTATAGVVVEDLKFVTTNDSGEEKFIDPSGEWRLHKKLSFNGLRAYCEAPEDRRFCLDLPAMDRLTNMTDIAKSSASAGRNIVLGPIDGTAHAIVVFKKYILDHQENSFATITVDISEFVANLSREQYVAMLAIADLMTENLSKAPKAEDAPASALADIATYELLFEKSIFKELTPEQVEQWDNVQKRVNGPDTVDTRKRVYANLKDGLSERRKQLQAIQEEEKKNRGFFSGWGSSSKSKEDAKLYKQLEKEYGIDGDDEEVVDLRSLPEAYCWQDLTVRVGKIGAHLTDEKRWDRDMTAAVADFTFHLRKLKKEGSLTYKVTVKDILVDNPTRSASWVPYICSRMHGTDGDGHALDARPSLLHIDGQVNPVVQPIEGCFVDANVVVKLQPVVAIGDPLFFASLGNFFRVPKSVKLAGLAEATANMASTLRDGASAVVADAFAGSKVVHVEFDAQAPTLVIPASLESMTPLDPVLSVSLGRFQLQTEPLTMAERERRVKLAQNVEKLLEDPTLVCYSNKASLTQISAALGLAGPCVRDAGRIRAGREHFLLPPFAAEATVFQRMVALDERFPATIVKGSAGSLAVAASLHDSFVLRQLTDTWADKSRDVAPSVTDMASQATFAGNASIAPTQPLPDADEGRNASGAGDRDAQRRAGGAMIDVSLKVESLVVTLMSDDKDHLAQLRTAAETEVQKTPSHRPVLGLIPVGQRRQGRFTLSCNDLDVAYHGRLNGGKDVCVEVAGISVEDTSATILQPAPLTVRVTLPHTDLPPHLSYTETEVVLPKPLRCTLGTPLMEVAEMAIDVSNMLTAADEHDLSAVEQARIEEVKRLARGGHERQRGSASRKRDLLTNRVRVRVTGAEVLLMNRDASHSDGAEDFDFATAGVSGVSVDVDMYASKTMLVSVAIEDVHADLADASLPFRHVLGPLNSDALSPGRRQESQQAKQSDVNMCEVEFRTFADPTFVAESSDRSHVSNLADVDFAKELSLRLNPAQVTYDSFTLMTLIEYATTGFLARVGALGARKRYDGKTIPIPPAAPRQLTKINIDVIEPRALLPEDARRAGCCSLTAGLSKVSITNEIMRKNGVGSIATTIALSGLSLSHNGEANKVHLSGASDLRIDLEQPIIEGSMPGNVAVTCDNLGTLALDEAGYIDVLSLVSNNVLRFPPPKPAAADPSNATALAAAPGAGHAETQQNRTTVRIGHVGIVAVDQDCTVFAIGLESLAVVLEGTRKDVKWQSLNLTDPQQETLVDCSSGSVLVDAPRPNHQDMNLQFDLRQAAMTDYWVTVYDFSVSEAMMAAIAPLMGGGGDKPEPQPTPSTVSENASDEQQPPRTMSVSVSVPEVAISLLPPGSSNRGAPAGALTRPCLVAQTRGIAVQYDASPVGFDLAVAIAALRLDDSELGLPVLSDRQGTRANTDEPAAEELPPEFRLKMNKVNATNEQTIEIDIRRLMASVYMPSIRNIIRYAANDSITSLAKLGEYKEARARREQQPKAAAAKSSSSSPDGTELPQETAAVASKKGCMKIAVAWEQPTICFPSGGGKVRPLHRAVAQNSMTSFGHGAQEDGVILDLGMLTADVVLDYEKDYQAVDARLKNACITGLLTDTEIGVNFQHFVKDRRQRVEASVGNTMFTASPKALTVLNSVLVNNVTVADSTPAVDDVGSKVTSQHVDPTVPLDDDDDASSPKQPSSDTTSLEVVATMDTVAVRCTTDEDWVFAVYRVRGLIFGLDPSGNIQLDVASISGKACDGADRPDSPDDATTKNMFRRQHLTCGDSQTNAITVRVDTASGTTEVDLALVTYVIIPEVLGRTIDLALVFVSPEASSSSSEQITTAPKQQQKQQQRLVVKLSRVTVGLLAVDGSDLASLFLDGFQLKTHVDGDGLSHMHAEIKRITMTDKTSTDSVFRTIINNSNTNSNSSSDQGTSFFEVSLDDRLPAKRMLVAIPGIASTVCPRFTRDCAVCISALTFYLVPAVVVEVKASALRAAAVMSNLDSAKQRAASASKKASEATPTDLMHFTLTMQRPTLHLVRDVTVSDTVGITPGALSISNALEVHGMRAYQVYSARLDDMAIEALGDSILRQRSPCQSEIRVDATPREALRLAMATKSKPGGLSSAKDLEDWSLNADVNLPPLVADVSSSQFAFLLGFAAALSASDARRTTAAAATTLKEDEEARRKLAARSSEAAAPSPDRGATSPAMAPAKNPALGASSSTDPVDEVRNRRVKVQWNGAELNLAAAFRLVVNQFAADAMLIGSRTTVQVTAGGVQLLHSGSPFLSSRALSVGLDREEAISKTETAMSTTINADLGATDVALAPSAVSEAVKLIYDPVQRHLLKIPEPGPMLQLDESHEVKLSARLKPTPNNPIEVCSRTLSTYVLNLNGQTLDLTAVRAPAPLIILRDRCLLTIENGTLRLPGTFGLRSFINFGFDTRIEYNKSTVCVERPTLAELRAEDRSATGAAPSGGSAAVQVHGPVPVPAAAVPAEDLVITAKMALKLSIADDGSEDPVGLRFSVVGTLSQKTDGEGCLVQRSLACDLCDVTDVMSDLVLPTNIGIRTSGTNNVHIVIECGAIVATLRFGRARYVVSTAKKILEVLPNAPGAGLKVARDIDADALAASSSASKAAASAPTSGTEVDVKIPSVDLTVIGKQGEMVQACLSQLALTVEDGSVITAQLEATVWASNPYCGQWEVMVEQLDARCKINLAEARYKADVSTLLINVSGAMLQTLHQLQRDVGEIVDADDAKWTRKVTATVNNWTDSTVVFEGTAVRPRGQQILTVPRPLASLITCGVDEASAAAAAEIETASGAGRQFIALDRSAVVAAPPYIADVTVTNSGGAHVDVVPVHSRDGVVKVVSTVSVTMLIVGVGTLEPHGSLFLGRECAIDNAVVIEPFVDDDDYEKATPNSTDPSFRKLLNGGEFHVCARSKTRPNVGMHFRISARNVGISLGVPRFEIVVRGGFTFKNLLPHTVEVDWVAPATNQPLVRSRVRSNQELEMFVAPAPTGPGSVNVRFTVGEAGTIYDCPPIEVVEGDRRLPLRAPNSAGQERDLAVMIHAGGNTLSLYAPFYIVNHTVIPLEMQLRGDRHPHRRNFAKMHGSCSNAVVCTPPMAEHDDDGALELMAILKFNRFESAPVPLHVNGQVCHVEVVDREGNGTLHFTYETSFTDDTYTSRTVLITPRWVVVNRTPSPLYFCQDLGTSSINKLKVNAQSALQYYSMERPPGDIGYRVNVGRTGLDATGKGFSADALCSGRVVVGDRSDPSKLELIQVTVKPEGPITYVTADTVTIAPHFFINRTSEAVEIIDGETCDVPQHIGAFGLGPFLFCDQRTSDAMIKIRVAGSELPIRLDREEQVSNPLNLAYTLQPGPRGQTMVTLYPAGHAPGQGRATRYRQLTNIVYEDQEIHLAIYNMRLSMAHNACEIAHLVVRDIKLDEERKMRSDVLTETVKASVLSVQVDNTSQERPPHDVAVFSLKNDSKSHAFKLALDRTVTGAKGFVKLNSVAVDLQPLIVQVSDFLMVKVLGFINEATGSAPASQGPSTATGQASKPGATGAIDRPEHNWPYKDEKGLYAASPVAEGAMAMTIRIEKIVINPVYVRLWFQRQRDHDVLAEHLGPAVSKLAITLEDVVLQAEGYAADKIEGSVDLVKAQMVAFYTYQIKSQLFGLAFQYMSSIPLVGAPFKYAATIGTGVAKFFTEPIEGLTESPAAFATGFAKGTTTLVGSVVGGGFGAISDVTRAGSQLANVASGEKADSGHSSKTPGLVRGFAKGITGLFTKPVKGAAEGGITGAAKGLAQGVVGVVAAPVGGILSDVSRVSKFASGVLQSTHVPSIDRVRRPRIFGHTGAMLPVGSVIALYEYNRLHDDMWSSALLPSDGPRSRVDDRSSSKSDVERHYGVPADAARWHLDRCRTNFDGWVYGSEYWDEPYRTTMDSDTHLRRRRWVLIIKPKATAPRNPGGLASVHLGAQFVDEPATPAGSPAAGSTTLPAAAGGGVEQKSRSLATPAGSERTVSAAGFVQQTATARVKVYEVYENQRFFPLSGWGKRMLPTDRHRWSNASGDVKMPAKDEVTLPVGWTWVSEWSVATEAGDKDGWEYAVDFPLQYARENSAARCVRRRVWRRVAQQGDGDAPSS